MAEAKFGINDVEALLSHRYDIKRLFSLRPLSPGDEQRLRTCPDRGLREPVEDAAQNVEPMRLLA